MEKHEEEAALGRKAMNEGEYAKAVRHFRRAITEAGEGSPPLAEYHELLVWNMFLNPGRLSAELPEILAMARRACELAPTSASAFCLLGSILEVTGERNQATAAFITALALKPDHPKAAAAFRRLADKPS